MRKKIKNIISKIDLFLYRKFGSEKKLYYLENIKEAKIIFSFINENEKENKVKFVGGCVRKSLCAEKVDDIDLATSLEPNELKAKLIKKNIKIIDTGISHGTITVILNKIKFEITTLREDVLTDGRHAKIKFTQDWSQDALRRDFTINAIYADIDGKIFDPCSGINDLKNGSVKFIGDIEKRINEDYLRILRYFRFFLQYSKSDHDSRVIQSIKKNLNGLNIISKERIFSELLKIIKLKNFSDLFKNNFSKSIFLNIFPEFKYFERLNKIHLVDKKLKGEIDEFLILAILVVDKSDNSDYFSYKYKLSNKIKNKFIYLHNHFQKGQEKLFFEKKQIKKLLYFDERRNIKDLLFFTFFSNDRVTILDLETGLKNLNNCAKPNFPFSTEYIKKKFDFEDGKELGNAIKKVKKYWLSRDFKINESDLKNIIK